MASVRKRIRNGKMEGWVVDYFDQAGKRHIKTFKREREAIAWRAETTIEVKKGIHTPENKSITISEAGLLWLQRSQTEKLERSTLEQYKNHIARHINPRIGGVKLARLTVPMVEDFKDKMLNQSSRAMTRKVLVSLKSIIRDAMRRGAVSQNAALSVKVETKNREKAKLLVGRDIPSKEEIAEILFAARGRHRPFLITAARTGLRASELRGLHWDAIDFDRCAIHVRERADLWGELGRPKSEAGDREVPMTPQVRSELLLWREWRLMIEGRLGLVFGNGVGKPESHANIVNRIWYPVQIAAGVTHDGGAKYGLHALRHFYASWIIEQEFSPKRVQALLGHSSIQMTYDRYGHLFPSLEDDHAKMARAEASLPRAQPTLVATKRA